MDVECGNFYQVYILSVCKTSIKYIMHNGKQVHQGKGMCTTCRIPT